MTVFAIPAVDVVSSIPLSEAITWQVADALRAGGYEVSLVDATSPTDLVTPVMNITIEQFDFRNYTWLFFYMPTWGDITILATLRDVRGNIAFSERFSGSGRSACRAEACGFGEATSRAMTQMLNSLIKATASDAFLAAFASPVP